MKDKNGTREQVLWFCPVCGIAHGMRATKKVDYIILEKKPYLETIDFDPDKPFGVVLETLGRGKGKRIVRYIGPEDASEDFTRVKQRLLACIQEWLKKEWLNKTDLEALKKD